MNVEAIRLRRVHSNPFMDLWKQTPMAMNGFDPAIHVAMFWRVYRDGKPDKGSYRKEEYAWRSICKRCYTPEHLADAIEEKRKLDIEVRPFAWYRKHAN